ncbi:MAG: hypothetical protein IH944_01190 [Armatimonadetes bacterium]|nr:hypothetical protein [Armatimonadota bacterium]
MRKKHPGRGPDMALLRQAALIGPGYKGQREEASREQRTELAGAFSDQGIAPPSYLVHDTTWIDRRAKLFEAGDYPDKGITVDPEHLSGLAQGFDLPVPLLIEHATSPLELGYLTSVEADGDELFGTVTLSAEANELIEKSGAQSLSLGLSPELDVIREVSLVKKPRIGSARLFNEDGYTFFGSIVEEEIDWRAKYESTTAQHSKQRAADQVGQFIADGKLLPAQAKFAEALLQRDDTVLFDGETVAINELVKGLIESGPQHNLFKELAPNPTSDQEQHDLPPAEAQFYAQHFPGLSLSEIAKRREPLNSKQR